MAHQSEPDNLPCFPDEYLTKEKLDSLLHDFRSSLHGNMPETLTFSHLVNGTRQAYMSEILGLQREIIRRSDIFENRISELKQLYESRPDLASHERESGCATTPICNETPSSSKGHAGDALPVLVNTHTVHVGAVDDLRRDMLGWDSHDQYKWAWIERFVFKAFKFKEIGTIKISIRESSSGYHRVNAFLPNSMVPEYWAKERMYFYAFESWRPNTEMISVGYAEDPERCIFVKGDHANKLDGLSEKFVFWVPV